MKTYAIAMAIKAKRTNGQTATVASLFIVPAPNSEIAEAKAVDDARLISSKSDDIDEAEIISYSSMEIPYANLMAFAKIGEAEASPTWAKTHSR